MFRFVTSGESHGKGLVAIIEGIPAGLEVQREGITNELARRRLGYGRGPRQRFETDEVEVLSGLRHGRTLGSPIAIVIHNKEWPKWEEEMNPFSGETKKPLTSPRPGHADLAGMQKWKFRDARNVLERSSARETAARVAAGAVAKVLLAQIDVTVISHVIGIGDAVVEAGATKPTMEDLYVIDKSDVRCFNESVAQKMRENIKQAAKNGDSLGGSAEVIAFGLPPGLGSCSSWDQRLDGRIAQALMSIQAIKAVEIGEGLHTSTQLGSAAHDAIAWNGESFERLSDFAGGIEGGMTTGSKLTARLWMKPLATLSRPVMSTVDVFSKQEGKSFRERTDVVAVPAMGVIAESMLSLVLCQSALEKFGGDSIDEFKRNYEGYVDQLKDFFSEQQ